MFIKTSVISFVNFNYGGKDSYKDIFPKYLEKTTTFCQPKPNWPVAVYTDVSENEVKPLVDLLKEVQVHGRLLDVLVFKDYRKKEPSEQQYERLLETRNLCFKMNQSENFDEFKKHANKFCEITKEIYQNENENYDLIAGNMKEVVKNDHIKLMFMELCGVDWSEND